MSSSPTLAPFSAIQASMPALKFLPWMAKGPENGPTTPILIVSAWAAPCERHSRHGGQKHTFHGFPPSAAAQLRCKAFPTALHRFLMEKR